VTTLCGCSSFRTEWEPALHGDSAKLLEGTTRIENVTQELGPPAQITALPQGCAFLYEHSVIGEFQFGISFDVAFLRWLKFVRAWNHLDQDVLVLTFDDDGILQGKGGKEWREQLGGGGAAQLLFVSISLTDPSLRRQRAYQHYWGRSALQPLPLLLNQESNLRTGANGFQQLRIAPKFVGQQTLEMTKPMPKKKRFRRRNLE
jgi:hypothetical protein